MKILGLTIALFLFLGMTGSTFVALQTTDYNSNNTTAQGLGVQATATMNSTTDIDLLVSDDSYVIGGLLLVKDAAWGDYLDMKVIDKDNVLGFGANTVIRTPVSNFYVATDHQIQTQFSFQTPGSKVPGGLYLRITYHSTSMSTSPGVAMNWFFQKVLY